MGGTPAGLWLASPAWKARRWLRPCPAGVELLPQRRMMKNPRSISMRAGTGMRPDNRNSHVLNSLRICWCCGAGPPIAGARLQPATTLLRLGYTPLLWKENRAFTLALSVQSRPCSSADLPLASPTTTASRPTSPSFHRPLRQCSSDLPVHVRSSSMTSGGDTSGTARAEA